MHHNFGITFLLKFQRKLIFVSIQYSDSLVIRIWAPYSVVPLMQIIDDPLNKYCIIFLLFFFKESFYL